jgi:hypothetical protein
VAGERDLRRGKGRAGGGVERDSRKGRAIRARRGAGRQAADGVAGEPAGGRWRDGSGSAGLYWMGTGDGNRLTDSEPRLSLFCLIGFGFDFELFCNLFILVSLMFILKDV